MRQDASVLLGVISDTHGLVRSEALDALRGCDAIVHAGDVGGPHVIASLEALAPVFAIRGNVDEPSYLRKKRSTRLDPDWAAALPVTRDLVYRDDALHDVGEGLRIHVLHDRNELAVAAERFALIVSGHSHQPRVHRGETIYLNPGSAGPRRFSLPISVARVDLPRRDVELLTLG